MVTENRVQHSVGDWEYDESTGQVDVPDGTICVGITWRPDGYLIEAAPDLYEVAKLAHAALRNLRNEGESRYLPIIRQLHAAIGKAEGAADYEDELVEIDDDGNIVKKAAAPRCECARGIHDVLNTDCPKNWAAQ